MDRVIYAVIARIPPDGVAEFQAYESAVLPLLSEYAARLDRRVRSADGTVEIHLIEFPSEQARHEFLADPRRQALLPWARASGASTEIFSVVPAL